MNVAPISTIKRNALGLSLSSSPSSSLSGQTFMIISLLLLCYKSDRELEQQQTLVLEMMVMEGEWKKTKWNNYYFVFNPISFSLFIFKIAISTSHASNCLQSTSIRKSTIHMYINIIRYVKCTMYMYPHNWEYVCA